MTFPRLSCVLLLVALPAAAQARLQLPQADTEVVFSPSDQRVLRNHLAPGKAAAAPTLSLAAEQILVRNLPPALRDACRAMVGQWGTQATGTARWGVRVLHRVGVANRHQLILSYRCGSSLPDYAGYFDERPAVLALEPNAVRLRFIPVDKPCAECSDLYRVSFSQAFVVENGTLVELKANSTNDNPALGVLDVHLAERLLYVLLPEARKVLSVVRAAEFVSHDDVGGDTKTTCRVVVSYPRGRDGRLAEINVNGRCNADDARRSSAIYRYKWNATTRRFD